MQLEQISTASETLLLRGERLAPSRRRRNALGKKRKKKEIRHRPSFTGWNQIHGGKVFSLQSPAHSYDNRWARLSAARSRCAHTHARMHAHARHAQTNTKPEREDPSIISITAVNTDVASRKYNTVGTHQNHWQVYVGKKKKPLELKLFCDVWPTKQLTCLLSSHNTVIVLQARGRVFSSFPSWKAIWLEASGDSQVTGHRAHAQSVVPSQLLIALFMMTLLAFQLERREGRRPWAEIRIILTQIRSNHLRWRIWTKRGEWGRGWWGEVTVLKWNDFFQFLLYYWSFGRQNEMKLSRI